MTTFILSQPPITSGPTPSARCSPSQLTWRAMRCRACGRWRSAAAPTATSLVWRCCAMTGARWTSCPLRYASWQGMSHDDCHELASELPHTRLFALPSMRASGRATVVGVPRAQVLEKGRELRRDLYQEWDEVVIGNGDGGITRDMQLMIDCSEWRTSGGARLAVIAFCLETTQKRAFDATAS